MDKSTLENIKDLYKNVVWTHKIQEKESEILHNKQLAYNIISIIMLSITSSGILGTIFVDELIFRVISAIVSFISLIISIVTITNNYEVLSVQHKRSALDFLCLRNDLKVFLSDIEISRYTKKEILRKRDQLYDNYNALCKNSFSSSKKAVRLAEKELEGEFEKDE